MNMHSYDLRASRAGGRIALAPALAFFLGLSWSSIVDAGYVGESFLQVPGVSGGWSGEKYKEWVKFEAREWLDVWRDPNEESFCANRRCTPEEKIFLAGQNRYVFRGPVAPRDGPGRLAVALDKRSPAHQALMELCRRGAKIPQAIYAESADLARIQGEIGPRPQEVPEFFEYELTDVELSCPVVSDAPEQAFVFRFGAIRWRNYEGKTHWELEPAPAQLPPPPSGESLTFIVTRVSSASDNSPDECPELNKEPTEADYFALWPKEKVAQGKAELARQGGFAELGATLAYRGPDGLNVCALPGIVPDPGHHQPRSDVARGFDLDGFDGEGEPPPGVHRHKNFVSEDGRKGIDNQHYLIDGCIPGFKRNGNFTNIRNEFMRKGSVSVLVEISGIDNMQNDDSVAVTVLYSDDHLVNSVDGHQVLPNYTFRISNEPALTHMFTRFRGRIENGVIITDPVERMVFQDGGQMAYRIFDARMRIELLPDGQMKAVLGGYQDWRILMSYWGRQRIFEPTMRYHCPGIYNAFKRAADGLKDSVTGEFNGISVAYDLDGVKAFIAPRRSGE